MALVLRRLCLRHQAFRLPQTEPFCQQISTPAVAHLVGVPVLRLSDNRSTCQLSQLVHARLYSTEQQGQADPPTKREQLKLAVRDYGSTVVVFHVAISLASLGGFYLAVSSGLDMVGLVSALPLVGEKAAASDVAAGASTFVVAYAVHKCFAPVRISITLASAPLIVRYLRARGILKTK